MTDPARAGIVGVVLAGGSSRRMGQDKALLAYHGEPQVRHCVRLLESFCESVLVSLRASQAAAAGYADLSLLVDPDGIEGPAAGLLAAWERVPDAALLALAVDMPLVDPPLLTCLISHRAPSRSATVFRHPDRTLEPLCAIYEPAAAAEIKTVASREPAPSLRRYLESAAIEVLDPPDPAKLLGANSPEARARVLAGLRRG